MLCVERCHLLPSRPWWLPFASGLSVLTDEAGLGTVCIDMGAGIDDARGLPAAISVHKRTRLPPVTTAMRLNTQADAEDRATGK